MLGILKTALIPAKGWFSRFPCLRFRLEVILPSQSLPDHVQSKLQVPPTCLPHNKAAAERKPFMNPANTLSVLRMKTPASSRLVLRAIGAVLLMAGMASAEEAAPFFFVQLTDPQIGMFSKNADFQHETANFEFAVASINRLKPAFVIVTGDLTNKTGDETQIAEYLRLTAKIDRSIPCYNVPGNHDLGNEPTAESLAAYQAHFGPDHYSFRHGPMVGLVLDSPLMWARKNVLPQADQQRQWLTSELEKAKQEGAGPVIVFQHHPWFSESIDEPDAYENIPLAQRRPCLDLLRQYGVTHVFAGHYHANMVSRYESLELVTTGALGKPLRKDVSGMRIVIVRGGEIEHRFYHLGEIPHQIDPAPVKKR